MVVQLVGAAVARHGAKAAMRQAAKHAARAAIKRILRSAAQQMVRSQGGAAAHFHIRGIAPTGEPIEKWARQFTNGEYKRKVILPAIVDGLNRTAAKSRTRSMRRIAKASLVPVKVVRSRTRLLKASKHNLDAGASFVWRPVNPVGTLKTMQTAAGVRAGRHSFPGAFIAQGSSSYERWRPGIKKGNSRLLVFAREGRDRYPLEVQKVELVGFDATWRSIIGRYSKTYLPRRISQQIDYRAKKFR